MFEVEKIINGEKVKILFKRGSKLKCPFGKRCMVSSYSCQNCEYDYAGEYCLYKQKQMKR